MLHPFRSSARAAVLASLVATFAAPALAEDVTIATARGEATVPATTNVAAFDIAAIDTMQALGVTPAGVPDTLYVDYLSDVAGSATNVGTLFEPDLEALAGMAPELIVIGGRSAAQYDAVAALAPTIDMTISADLVADARARIAAYGTLFDKEAEAEALVASLDAEIAATTASAAGKGTALILLTNGPKISAYGKGSRFGWIHDALGLPEAHPNLDPQTHGDAVSFEFIAEVNPDWLIVVDRASAIGEPASAEATLDNPLVAETTAWKNGQVIYLPAAPVYIAGGGYSSLMTTLGTLRAGFGG